MGSTGAFAFGMFSTAGCRPFAGVVRGEHVLAIEALMPKVRANGHAIEDASSVSAFLRNWAPNFAAIKQALADLDETAPWGPLASLRIHAPIDAPRQIFCSGANYRQHVVDIIVDRYGDKGKSLDERRALAVAEVDDRAKNGAPYIFSKLVSCIAGPEDVLILPSATAEPDWELELGVVFGKGARNVSRDAAMDAVAGYVIVNDITNRDMFVRHDVKALGTDWIMCKSSPGYLPMGPWFLPAEFAPRADAFQITLKLNGEVMQDESSSDMIFDVARQVEFLSQHVEILAGDLLATGSPAGNGTHHGRYLKDGDVMQGTITALGTQRVRCVRTPEARPMSRLGSADLPGRRAVDRGSA